MGRTWTERLWRVGGCAMRGGYCRCVCIWCVCVWRGVWQRSAARRVWQVRGVASEGCGKGGGGRGRGVFNFQGLLSTQTWQNQNGLVWDNSLTSLLLRSHLLFTILIPQTAKCLETKAYSREVLIWYESSTLWTGSRKPDSYTQSQQTEPNAESQFPTAWMEPDPYINTASRAKCWVPFPTCMNGTRPIHQQCQLSEHSAEREESISNPQPGAYIYECHKQFKCSLVPRPSRPSVCRLQY